MGSILPVRCRALLPLRARHCAAGRDIHIPLSAQRAIPLRMDRGDYGQLLLSTLCHHQVVFRTAGRIVPGHTRDMLAIPLPEDSPCGEHRRMVPWNHHHPAVPHRVSRNVGISHDNGWYDGRDRHGAGRPNWSS